jgi:Subtilase family/Fibronectin type-III domain/Peptidase inhibitor I9/PA domain
VEARVSVEAGSAPCDHGAVSRASRLLSAAATVAVGVVLLGLAPGPVVQAADTVPDPFRATAPGVYVVTLAAPPAALHIGTRPADGARFDRARPQVASYVDRLTAAQDEVLHAVGDPAVLYRYTTALNGFAATLSSDQVTRLRTTPGVELVERSTKQHVDRAPAALRATPVVGSSSRSLLGLDGPGGVWAAHGGPENAGRDVVIGVVDTGIWPDNPSFTGLPQRTPGTAGHLPGFHGACDQAQEWTAEDCNDKVVSARWFVKGFGEENVASAEYLSPRDGTGHGSHVASTAAGDYGVRVEVDGQRFGTTSGMAPAARLAVYKACWTAPDPTQDGCTTADTVAAVDQAVADGVDVLNYSVSGSDRLDDSVERAFLGATAAGVFVAASAGNGGREAGTVAHVAPWITTVGASTHHAFQGAVRLGDGRSLVGAMVSDQPVRATGLVLGSAVAAAGADPDAARRCETGSLDAARAEGKVVVCDRGNGARVDKSATVAAAGGAGMVLANTRPQSTDADVHAVPTVHLDLAEARTLESYLRGAGARATAALDPRGSTDVAVPSIAGFSGRGPALGAGGDVLKPDLTAPGVSVLGAVAPPSDSGRPWDLASGTSTSAPHVAGLAAFVAGVHPDWPPARIRSAMMTTAYDLRGRHDPLVEGAGHVAPQRFLDPGLVFDTSVRAWQQVLSGERDASDVNTSSLAIGDLVGPTTVTRRITNVTGRRESYSVRKHGLTDVDVQAFPNTVLLGPGQTRTVRLRVTARPSATVDRDVTGWLVWRGDRHTVRIPVTVRPTVVAAPRQVVGSGDSGTVVVRGRSGNGRTVKLHSTGLVAAQTTPVALTPGPFDPARPETGPSTAARSVSVPAGTDVARFAVTSGAAGDDVDLYVYRGDTLVDSSTGSSPDAEVTLMHPGAGAYRVYVNAHAAEDGADATGDVQTWVVPQRGGSRVQLSTDAVGFAPGQRFRYSASWSGLDPDKGYLGVVTYGDTDRATLVEVN